MIKFIVVQSLSCVQIFLTPRTVVYQAPLSMGISKQEYCSGLHFPLPGIFLDPGIEPKSLALAGRFFTTEPPGKPMLKVKWVQINIEIVLGWQEKERHI